MFEAFLPDSEIARRLLPRLERAFKQGLTFTVVEKGAGAKVAWHCIPHKTTLHGGKSGWVKPLGMFSRAGSTTPARTIHVFLSLSGSATQTPPTSLAWRRS